MQKKANNLIFRVLVCTSLYKDLHNGGMVVCRGNFNGSRVMLNVQKGNERNRT